MNKTTDPELRLETASPTWLTPLRTGNDASTKLCTWQLRSASSNPDNFSQEGQRIDGDPEYHGDDCHDQVTPEASYSDCLP